MRLAAVPFIVADAQGSQQPEATAAGWAGPALTTSVRPRVIPKADLALWRRLRDAGFSEAEAEERVLEDWRHRWALGCVARVTGELFRRAVPAWLVLELVTAWAAVYFGLDEDSTAGAVDWVAAREVERRRGARRAS
jgi:hypothetical protein